MGCLLSEINSANVDFPLPGHGIPRKITRDFSFFFICF